MTTTDRIQRCPLCDYYIQGLPEVHNCPECGFLFDEHSVGFNLAPIPLFGEHIARMIISIGVIAAALFAGFGVLVALGIGITVGYACALTLWLVWGKTRRIAVGPESVAIRRGNRPVRAIRLDDIAFLANPRAGITARNAGDAAALRAAVRTAPSPSSLTAVIARRVRDGTGNRARLTPPAP